jgi:hypothetical protein
MDGETPEREYLSGVFVLDWRGFLSGGDCGGEFELFGVVLVEEGLEVGAAAGFVEAGGANYN